LIRETKREAVSGLEQYELLKSVPQGQKRNPDVGAPQASRLEVTRKKTQAQSGGRFLRKAITKKMTSCTPHVLGKKADGDERCVDLTQGGPDHKEDQGGLGTGLGKFESKMGPDSLQVEISCGYFK